MRPGGGGAFCTATGDTTVPGTGTLGAGPARGALGTVALAAGGGAGGKPKVTGPGAGTFETGTFETGMFATDGFACGAIFAAGGGGDDCDEGGGGAGASRAHGIG